MTTRPARTRRMRSAWIMLAALLVVGCSPGVARPAPTSRQVGALPAPTSTPPVQVTQVEAPPSPLPPVAEPTSAGAEPTPTLRMGLQATDPRTVELASGEPQMVEFFAYW
jgi:hypothetical protein